MELAASGKVGQLHSHSFKNTQSTFAQNQCNLVNYCYLNMAEGLSTSSTIQVSHQKSTKNIL